MRYENISALVSSDTEAKNYFDALPKDLQNALLAHGNGVNTLEELKHFAGVIQRNG